MDRVEHLGVKEAALFEGVNPKTLLRRLERKRVVLANDDEDGRRRLVPVTALSGTAIRAWMKKAAIVPAARPANALHRLFSSRFHPRRSRRFSTPRHRRLHVITSHTSTAGRNF